MNFTLAGTVNFSIKGFTLQIKRAFTAATSADQIAPILTIDNGNGPESFQAESLTNLVTGSLVQAICFSIGRMSAMRGHGQAVLPGAGLLRRTNGFARCTNENSFAFDIHLAERVTDSKKATASCSPARGVRFRGLRRLSPGVE